MPWVLWRVETSWQKGGRDIVEAALLGRNAQVTVKLTSQQINVTRAMDERRMQWSADDLIKNRPALSRWHPDFKAAFDAFMRADKMPPK